MWQAPDSRMALLELLVTGRLKRRRAQAIAWDTLEELPWTRKTGRRDELGLVESRRDDLVVLMARVWPDWGDVLAELTARGLSPTPDGWKALEDARRAADLALLPPRLNRRTAASLSAPHSKARLTERRLMALGRTEPMHDGSVRIRPPRGLVLRTERGDLDLSDVAIILGEVAIPERAFGEGLSLVGDIRALLLIENLGAFCDLPFLEGWLFAHVPGWDTATIAKLLARIGDIPVIHFGDLDPNGVRIVQHLRGLHRDLLWFVPSFWREFIESKGQKAAWPNDLSLTEMPALVRDLAVRGLWLEQEPLVVDPRTTQALEEARLHSRYRWRTRARATC